MKLTQEILTELAKKTVEDEHLCNERKMNKRRYLMFSGATKAVIEAAIKAEFKKEQTIQELMNRLVPLNIMQKIINKLAGVYKEAPIRKVNTKDETEQQNLEDLVDVLELNIRMKEANRFFKMNKKALIEPYLDDDGKPSIRVLPAHTYECYSYKTKKKSKPNIIVKIDEVAERLIWWTDESHVVTNYKGEPVPGALENNEDLENPYGRLHFEFINESSSSVNPIQDDDLLALSVAIPVILTDLLFGLKYQCWAILWTVGKVGDIPFNPNSVIQMEFGDQPGQNPSVNSIKPDIDSDKMLNTVLALVSLLLTTKNLQAGSIGDASTAQNAASGIAKMIDSSESVEDKKDQQAYFYKAEKNLFNTLVEMMRYWKETRQLHEDYDFDFPDDFTVSVSFQDPRPMMSETEQIENSDKKIKAKLSTIKRELKKLYPQLDDTAIDVLYKEIIEESKAFAEQAQKAFQRPGDKNGIQSETED